ncbi:transcription factor tfb2 [Spizellomyces punctatus DAOM BR117]|uniref:RNA polymerase II transcription factor B subunit 2 n=1 Tax=Spizellomyces punctatus (strain DAOM BR117) TaxID=645134 RepID=A0A0L0HT65_SPIPD|nr:transcription factor tfb2 [Spizellomyces punctatus DAOM BR117]KND04070.1 transcription factor tfb2 [Spizellomyces punctatus DAOM BR117]|eukprot:XP_016612109.1 transcription factor tfb2 [Spizellomyces punctatus DAOM BR117]
MSDSLATVKNSIQEYLETLPKQTFDKLYTQPATCLAALRLLPPVAKQIVMRLLYTQRPVLKADVEAWCFQEHRSDLRDSLKKLAKMNICTETGSEHLQINRIFQENMHNALVGGGTHASFGKPADTQDKYEVDIPFLDRYASEAWEAVLHYLVGTPTEKRPKAVGRLLVASGLQEQDGRSGVTDDERTMITSKGFQFLLLDVNVQVWSLLLQYLELAERQLQMDIVEVLNFLFQVGSLELGQSYSIDPLTDTQKMVLEDLKWFGLFYQRKKKSSRFYPTRMATSLTSGSMIAARKPEEGHGYIIVETNYRIYAYTESPLQIAILSLFVSLQARFQNMVVGLITRDGVRDALAKGITADQIITYLTAHAHPEMRKQSPILPETVVDQIRLWEMERNRLRVSRAYMYNDFPDIQEYKQLSDYAEPFGAILWKNDKKRILVVTEEGHEQVKAFKKRKQAAKGIPGSGGHGRAQASPLPSR